MQAQCPDGAYKKPPAPEWLHDIYRISLLDTVPAQSFCAEISILAV
jgi:hypothetical protein